MSLALNASASDVVMFITTPLSPFPTSLTGAFGVDEVIELDDVEDRETDMTIDGTMINWKRPRKIIGRITLQGNASSTLSLINFIDEQNKKIVPEYATLIVVSPSNIYTGTYNDVIFTTKFKGFEYVGQLKPIVFTFHASSINKTALASVVSIASGVAGLL